MNTVLLALAVTAMALCCACDRLSRIPRRFADLRNGHAPRQNGVSSPIGIDATIAAIIARVSGGGTLVEAFEEQGGMRFATPRITAMRAQRVLRIRAMRDESEEDIARAAHHVASACALSERLGCEISDCLQAAATAHERERRMYERKREVFAMPKATIRLLSGLPAVTVALGEVMGSHPLRFLLGSGQGMLCLLAGLTWYGFGMLWTWHMLNEFETSGNASAIPLTLQMLHAALLQGSSLPGALTAVGEVIDDDVGHRLRSAGLALIRGMRWREAWLVGRGNDDNGGEPQSITLIAECLHDAWQHGVSPTQRLELAARQFDHSERSAIEQAASRLSVRLLAPTGLCFLPAFVLIGVVPAVASFAL